MEWHFLIKKNLSLLFDELITQGQIKKYMKEILGVEFGFDNYRAIDSEASYLTKEIEETDKLVRELYESKGPKFFKKLIKKWYVFVKFLEKTAVEISRKNYSGRKNEELFTDFEKLKRAYLNLSTALYAPLIIKKFVDKIIKDKLKELPRNKAEEYFNILTSSEKDDERTKELRSIIEMAIQFKEKKSVSKTLKVHISRFGWINSKGFARESWSEEEILERIKAMLGEDLEKKMEEIKNRGKEIKSKTKNILGEIRADRKFKSLVKITKEYVFFRMQRMDIFVKSGFLARPLFKEMAKRINLDIDSFFYLTSGEIKEAFTGKKDFSELINERKKGFGFIRNKENITVLSGKALQEYKEKYMQEKINNIMR